MDALVSPFDDVSELDPFSLPFDDDRDVLSPRQHVTTSDVRHGSLETGDARQGLTDAQPQEPGSIEAATKTLEKHKTPTQDPPKKPGISRSTYFRAKRNLKSHGSIRSNVAGKQIGRPQKLDENAERVRAS